MEYAQIQIQQVFGPPQEYSGVGKQSGAQYTVWTWQCSGTANGMQASPMIVKTMSAKMMQQIGPGFAWNAEVKEFQGKTEYVVRAPQSQGNQGGGQQGQQQQGQQQQQASSSYTLDEWKALCTEGLQFAMQQMPQCEDQKAVVSLAATFIIGAKDMRLKVFTAPPAQQQGQQGQAVQQQAQNVQGAAAQAVTTAIDQNIMAALNAQGPLYQNAINAGITDADLALWWQQNGAQAPMFVGRVNAEIQQRGAQ